MSKQPITIEELKALIANGIKQENLHEVLPEDAIDRIKEKILSFKKREDAKEIPGIVSELDIPKLQAGEVDNREIPDESQLIPSPEQQVNVSGNNDNNFQVDSGNIPTEQPYSPTMGYAPELPEMLKKAAPSELFVFQYTDINESGENLSFKPMRLMDDPDVKKSMQELWIEEGKTKANIYVAKFEKMGEIHFNYTDGTSKFVQDASTPDYAGGQVYKDNPYAASSVPQIDEPKKAELESYIKSSVDLEKVVHDIVMNILKNSLLTNSERAFNEDISATETPGFGTREDQLVKPMEESVSHEDEEIEFKVTMQEIVESDGYEKIVLPEELNECIKSGDKKLLKRGNEQVQEWTFNGNLYYTPIGRISKDKGYIKV
ncbi:MAG: hypothetical protein AABY15_05885 [Nanoarchaeota archaeon]|mgnify:CR=1 FL=1